MTYGNLNEVAAVAADRFFTALLVDPAYFNEI